MQARLVEVIEVSIGGVRRYFTRTGEPIGVAFEGVHPGLDMALAKAFADGPSGGCGLAPEEDHALVARGPVEDAIESSRLSASDIKADLMRKFGGPRVAPPFDPEGPQIEPVRLAPPGGEQ